LSILLLESHVHFHDRSIVLSISCIDALDTIARDGFSFCCPHTHRFFSPPSYPIALKGFHRFSYHSSLRSADFRFPSASSIPAPVPVIHEIDNCLPRLTRRQFDAFLSSKFVSKRWMIVMWGFKNPDSSVSYEQFKSNLVDVPTYMRHVVALHLAQQGRFP
jgi:hypothetical protein